MDDYKSEAREEWFESAEDLMDYFKTNADEMLENEYLKLNLKYLAKILLDENLARAMLETIAKRCKSGIGDELVQFCLDRIFFIETRVLEKNKAYSPELVAALGQIYPTVKADIETECRFSVSPKLYRAVELEMERFRFGENPVRAIALALQNLPVFALTDTPMKS